MTSLQLLSLAFFFLFGSFFLKALHAALNCIHKRDLKVKAVSKRFFYRTIHLFFFPKQEYEGLFFATISALNLTRFCYAASIVAFLAMSGLAPVWLFFNGLIFIIIGLILGDFLPRIVGTQFPDYTVRYFSFFASIFLLLAFPITFLLLTVARTFSHAAYLDHLHEPAARAKREIIEMIEESDVSPSLHLHDKKLIESVLTFRDKIAREVMVPRVDLFSLSADTSVKEAAKQLEAEGYSRVPIYRNTVDNIVGVLMYKDIIEKYMEYEQKGNDSSVIEAPVEKIMINALYTPETKKISMLLQEFRKKKVHIAIVVDEYGGTEGIVTIEDILEEIVGEIADEYDEEEDQCLVQPDGSWIVDTRLSILDAEEQLGIKIPQEGDYDTLGGFIFHCAGTIPSRGFVIHRDDFEIEVLRSSERHVEKARIRPVLKEEETPETH